MIEWFAKSIAVFLAKENIITKEDDREVCQYGIEVIYGREYFFKSL